MKTKWFAFIGFAAAALLTASAANAEQWTLGFSGTGTSGNIVFTATHLSDIPARSQITAATGTINGESITGLSNWWGANNVLYTNDKSFFADSGGIAFNTATNTYNLWNHYGAGMVASNLALGYVAGPDITFTLTQTAPIPEPETYAMLMAGLGVMGAMARRRKQKSIA